MNICTKYIGAALISLAGIGAAQAATINDGTLTYSTSGTNATVTGLVNANASVNNLTIPATVTSGNTTYTVTAVGASAFSGRTNVTGTLTLNNVTIGQSAFAGTGIGSVVITYFTAGKNGPNTDTFTIIDPSTQIGSSAFANCKSLAEIYMGFNSNTSNTLPTSAFAGCTALKKVVYTGGTLPAMGSAFGTANTAPSGAALYVLSTNITSAGTTAGWRNFSSISDAASLITGIELDQNQFTFANTSSAGVYAVVNALPNAAFNVIVHNGYKFSYRGGPCTVNATTGLVKPDASYGDFKNAFTVTYGNYSVNGDVYTGTDPVTVRVYYNTNSGFYVEYPMKMGDVVKLGIYPYYYTTVKSIERTPGMPDSSLYVTTLPNGSTGGVYMEQKGSYVRAVGNNQDNGLVTFLVSFNRLTETPTEVNEIAADDENAPVEYYTLQGVRIERPAAGQLVIRRQGSNVSKILVK